MNPLSLPSCTRAAMPALAVALTALLAPLVVVPAVSAEQPGRPNSVTAYGAADHHGPTGDMSLNDDLVGMAATASGGGYWLLGGDGGVFSFGDARFHGSTGNLTLNRQVVAMAGHPLGSGYWFVAKDGGVFAYGAAGFHGSVGDRPLNRGVVGMAPTPTGQGYWLVASDGGIFSFGDAKFHGSTGGTILNRPIVAMAATATGNGYWLVASDGGVFSFGDASFHGSLGDVPLNAWITGMAVSPGGDGYWMVAEDGGVFSFGDASFHGNAVADGEQVAVTVGMAAHPREAGYWLVHGGRPAREIVSTFTTPLQPGQSRNHNIRRAARYLDGAVIRPGERFSLNEAIGPRTPERGFVENGYIDEDGDLGNAVGGGVSQMGTTFLNTAWFSGIRIEEFRQHTIYFERYPMCREATLDWGSLDVVVVNDSPYSITVTSSATDSSVTVSLRSTPWAAVASRTSDPYNVRGDAFSVRCTRTVTYPGGTASSSSYTWRYESGYPG